MKQQAKKNNNKGFTLSEILAAVLIMSMMMVAIVSFVDYSSRIWRTGQEAVNNKNYSRLTFDLISQELMEANSIKDTTNPIGSSKTFIKLENPNKKYRSITYESDIKKLYLYGSSEEGDIKDSSGKKGNQFYNNTNTLRAEILLAKNVNTFTVTRLSTSTVQITLAIESSEEDEDGNHDIISSDTMILYAPMIR